MRIKSEKISVHRPWNPRKSADAAKNCSNGKMTIGADFQ